MGPGCFKLRAIPPCDPGVPAPAPDSFSCSLLAVVLLRPWVATGLHTVSLFLNHIYLLQEKMWKETAHRRWRMRHHRLQTPLARYCRIRIHPLSCFHFFQAVINRSQSVFLFFSSYWESLSLCSCRNSLCMFWEKKEWFCVVGMTEKPTLSSDLIAPTAEELCLFGLIWQCN